MTQVDQGHLLKVQTYECHPRLAESKSQNWGARKYMSNRLPQVIHTDLRTTN